MDNPGFAMGPGQPVSEHEKEIPSKESEISIPEVHVPDREEAPLEMPSDHPVTEEKTLNQAPVDRIEDKPVSQVQEVPQSEVLPEVGENLVKEGTAVVDINDAAATVEAINRINRK